MAPDKTVTVVLSGISGAGKSALFCNLFGEPVKKVLFTGPCTQEPQLKSVTKTIKGWKEEESKDKDIEIRVIDTQGLVVTKSPTLTLEDIKHTLQEKYKIHHFDLLVFCIPARIGAGLDYEQKMAMKSIQDFHGKEIWNKCVVVFTYSNQILNKIQEADKKVRIDIFKSKLDDIMAEFRAELNKLGADTEKLDPKTIFNWKASKKPLNGRILGIPAGFKIEDEVLPGIQLHSGEGWVDEIYLEIINKCEQKQHLDEHQYERSWLSYVAGIGRAGTGPGRAIRSPTLKRSYPDQVSIVFAGKGKYNLIQCLFGEDIKTKEPQPSHQLKKNGITLHITCIGSEEDIDKLEKFSESYVLVYCMRVSPGVRFHNGNPELMQCLHTVLGRDVWKHCVVACTFSNETFEFIEDDDNQYEAFINEYVERFNDQLKGPLKIDTITNEKVTAKSIFNYAPGGQNTKSTGRVIPVIPAGETEEDLVLTDDRRWSHTIFGEMINKCNMLAALEVYHIKKDWV